MNMNRDKAIRKNLACKGAELPYGFDLRLMNRITKLAEKRSRQAYVLNLVTTSMVSVVLLAGSLYALYHYFSFNILHIFSGFQFNVTPLLAWCGYISALMLLLLALDHMLRQRVGKSDSA
jgi:hypothetical protein